MGSLRWWRWQDLGRPLKGDCKCGVCVLQVVGLEESGCSTLRDPRDYITSSGYWTLRFRFGVSPSEFSFLMWSLFAMYQFHCFEMRMYVFRHYMLEEHSFIFFILYQLIVDIELLKCWIC